MDKNKQQVTDTLNKILEYCHNEQRTLNQIASHCGLKAGSMSHWMGYLVEGVLVMANRYNSNTCFYKSLVTSYDFFFEYQGTLKRKSSLQIKQDRNAERRYTVRDYQQFGAILPCGRINPFLLQARQAHADRQAKFRKQGAIPSGVDSMI